MAASSSSTGINLGHRTRQVPMRVLALGLPRTGTESLRKALEQLGFDGCYHGYAAAQESPRDCEIWMEGVRAKYDGIGQPFGRKEFDSLLGNCQALCDSPAVFFTEELLAVYPEAQVILSVRDFEDWRKSFKHSVLGFPYSRVAVVTDWLCWATRSPSRWTRPMLVKGILNMYPGDFDTNARDHYDKHYAMVRRICTEQKRPVLEWRVEEGWAPLCKFLGVAVPPRPFPKGNCAVETYQRMMSIVMSELRRSIPFLAVVCLLLYLVFFEPYAMPALTVLIGSSASAMQQDEI